MLSLHTSLIINNFNNRYDMFASIDGSTSDATYFDKVNLLHYNDNNIIKINIENTGKSRIFNVCEII